MTWVISNALMAAYESSLYSLAPAGESSVADCSDGEPSAPSSSSPTHAGFSSPDRMTALSSLIRFGMTFEPLTVDRGAGVLMWCLADFRVKTSAARATAKASPESSQDSGWRWPASFAKYSPDSSSWKIRQCSLLGGLESFLETWPRWGSMRNGECLERTTLAPPIIERESGSWLPTPTASDTGGYNRGGSSGRVGPIRPGLKMMARQNMWPTPTARDWKSGAASQATTDRNARPLNEAVYQAEGGGQLNPTWVAWLMGWPLGHTDLKPLATGKSQQWLRSHGGCLPREGDGDEPRSEAI